jgi:1-acyl-sn-glycerol-3-phosphate acyltransferase
VTRKLLHAAYQPYKYGVYIPFLAGSTLFFGGLTLGMVPLTSPRFASLVCGAAWARLNGVMTPIRVTVRGREHVDPKQSYVIVANHQSHFDVFVLYGWLGIDFKWVMKQELRKIPGLGIGCEMVGHIFIDRSSTARALASLEAAKRRIVDGTSVVFFPEGTRSRDGSLGEFKKGAFRMAIDLGLPILPLTIDGTRDILPPETMDLMPGSARVTIHAPIDTAGCGEDDLASLMERARAAIQSALPA